MRVITGKYKGRTINMPKGIRPTQGLTRKALFDILGDARGLSFLELFAGSGAVGIEALSQDAKKAVFVENDPSCIKALKSNFTYLPPEAYYLLPLDVFEAIKRLAHKKERFDIVFLDPPYYGDMAKKTLQCLGAYDILAANGFIIVQHFKKDNLPDTQGGLVLFRQARYGNTVLSFYRKEDVPESDIPGDV